MYIKFPLSIIKTENEFLEKWRVVQKTVFVARKMKKNYYEKYFIVSHFLFVCINDVSALLLFV